MNKNCYRVIFSRVLQRRVVVAESARIAHGQASAATESPATLASTTGTFCGLVPALRAGVRLALGLLVVVGPAQADIVADALAPATQRPIVLNTANGLPQVNIQTPSAAGVSRNSYSQFDVGSQGVILNNSRVDVQTQLGGWVTANPWLARGPARVILNEVNSASPSLLQGYIEVAGQRAQVVVANPAGISCNGCGFINASRSTLTTGSPVLNNGNLEAFVVQRGTIRIEGLGMDATRSDYSDVIARAVQLNAGLWTQQLNIVTGAAQVEAATGDAAPAVLGLATAAGAAPRYAVDVSALGGMYAGKIHLVGTEAGVGVANAGAIGASAGDVLVDIHGQLSNSGRINASTALNITTQQGVDNSGMLYAQQSLSVVAAGDVDNRHIMAAGQDVSLRSDGRIDSAPGSLLAAGLDTEGRLHDNGTLSLQATRDISLHGQVLAGSALTLQAANIDLAGSQAQAADMRFTTPGNLNLDRATVQASRQLALSAGQTLQTTAAILSAPRQLLEAHDVDNSGGLISSAGDISLSASALNNSGGIIQAQGNQSLMLGSGVIDNRDSLLYAGATLAITAGTLLNNNTLGDARGLQGRTLNLQLDTLDNTQGALRASDKLSVTSHGDINNSAGLMSAQGDLLLQDSDPGQRALQMLNTDGTVIADRSLALAMASLSGDGKLLSPGRIAISLDQDFTNSRLIQAGTDLQLGSKGLVSNQGQLLSTGNLTLQATRADNSAGAEINAATLRLNVSDTLINRGLIDGGDVRLVIGNMLGNKGTGRIYGDHLALQAGTLLNTDEVLSGVSTAAVIAARDRLDIGVVLLRNEHDALIFSGGAMAIGGALDSNGMTIGQAGEVDNIGSQIEASTALSLAVATLNNRNADFQTEIAPVGTPQTLFSLDPADDGNNNQYDIGNFERYSWSRTYKYRWKTAAAETAVAPEPGKTPLPQVGETEDCAADPCALLPMADYAAGNAAWSYFQIAPPAPEPAAPVMAEPVPPAGAETDPAYAGAWQTYHEDKAVYDSAWANYNTTHASWQAAT
ncbi:MAG TPA: filamentous hemagglutinin N-terminal domain-containing protein, partial [Moraxellaceae bacterium]